MTVINDRIWRDESVNEWVRKKITGKKLVADSYVLVYFVVLLGHIHREQT